MLEFHGGTLTILNMDAELSTFIQKTDFDAYEGDYTVIPNLTDQVLATRDKMMRDDVTVTSVPTYETSNPYGTTFYICKEMDE